MENGNRDWLTRDEAEAFVGKNVEYYTSHWRTHQKSDYFKGTNFAACFFFFEWMLYRKMYREAFLTIFVVFIYSFSMALLPMNTDWVDILLARSLNVFFGLFANALYRNKALQTVRKAVDVDENVKMLYLREKGGTSIYSLIVCIILEIAVAILPYFFY